MALHSRTRQCWPARNRNFRATHYRFHSIEVLDIYCLYGLQFHPESILTPEGHVLLQNFVAICDQHEGSM